MLHDRAANRVHKWIGRQQRPLEIEKIVERELFASFLHEGGDSVVTPFDVERGALPGIFAVTESGKPLQWNREPIGEGFLSLAAEPVGDCRVVRGGVRENLFRKQLAKIEIIVARFE